MKYYKVTKETSKIECDNCLIVITEKLKDFKGRNVTYIQIIPDKYTGEPKNKVIGAVSNVRVVTLKKLNK